MELSKFPGEELVLDIEIVCILADGDIFEDTSEPKLPVCNNWISLKEFKDLKAKTDTHGDKDTNT